MKRTKRRLLTGLLCVVLFMAEVMSTVIPASAVNLPLVQENGMVENSGDEDGEKSSSGEDLELGAKKDDDTTDADSEVGEDLDDLSDSGLEGAKDDEEVKGDSQGDGSSEGNVDNSDGEQNKGEEQDDNKDGNEGNPDIKDVGDGSVDANEEPIGNAEERLALMTSVDDIASGTYGNIAWIIDADGKLTVEGTGEIKNSGVRFAPWDGYRYSIKFAEINVSGMTDASYLFYYCTNLVSINLDDFDTSSVTNMRYMFSGCSSLTSLNVSRFNTRNVINMSNMFYGCSGLTSLNVSSFNTSNVADMSGMFYYCRDLTSLNVSGFNSSNVTNMSSMFSYCSGLKSLNVSGFNTSNVTDMSQMFSGCSSLTSLNISGFNTSNVTNMWNMFSGCSSLTSLDVSGFNTSNVTNMGDMFSYCRSLTSLNVSGFNTSNVMGMGSMFSGCSGITSLYVSNFNTSRITSMYNMFSGCSSLTSLDLSGFDTSNVKQMSGMFSGCISLKNLNVSSFNTGKVEYMDSMFCGCSSLTSLNVSSFNTSNVIYMSEAKSAGMFSNCSSLVSLDLSNFDTSKVEDMRWLFEGCSSLVSIDLSNFNLINAYADGMFNECSSLTTIYAPYNLDMSVELPADDGDIWYQSNGTIVTELPQNLSYSVALGKNHIPKEKEDFGNKLSNSRNSIFLFRNSMTKEVIKNGRVCIDEDGFSFTKDLNYYSPSENSGYVEVPLSKDCNRVFICTYFGGYEEIGGWVTDLSHYRSESGIYIFDLKPKIEKYTCKLPHIKTSVKTEAPDVETEDGNIALFNMDMGFDMDFGKGVKSTVTYDEDDKTIKVAISTEGKVSYDAIKEEYKASGSKSGKSLDEQFETAEEQMKPGNLCNVDVKMSVKGYLEFTETGKFLEGGAIVNISGSGTAEYRPVCTAGIGYAKYELGLSTEGKLLFTYVDGNLDVSAAVKFEPYAKITVGAGWSLAHAEIGASGKFPINITIPYVDDRESLSIDAVFELFGEVKFFCFGGKRTAKVEGNIWPAISFYNDALNTADLDIESDDLILLSRDYLSSNNKSRTQTYNTRNNAPLTSSDSFRYSEISEDKGVFEENNVQYVKLSDGTEILAWIHDFGNKSSANRTTLVYSINKNDGNGWSSITPICSDTSTGDYYPDMVAQGNKAYLVWCKASKEFNEDVSIAEICNNMDVYVSIFENDTFSEPQMISDANSGLVEFSPIVAANENSAAVAWMTNSVNDYHYTKGYNSIYVCEYKDGIWGKSVCYADNLNYVSDYDMDYVNGSVAVLYAEDADNVSDTQDGCVYYIRNGVKSRIGDDYYNAEIVDFCNGMIYFSAGNRIYKAAANNISYIYDTGIETSNFSVLKSASGAEAITFLNLDGFESNVYASYYRNGVYTSPVPVVADGSRVTNYSPVYNDDGTISIAYDEEEILENGDYIYGLTDMVIKKNVKPNLFFVDTDLAYNAYDVVPGNIIEFATVASNYTNNPISKVKVSLSGSNVGEIKTSVLDVDIPVGESKYVSISYTLPDNIVNQQYTLMVTPVDFDDTNLSDNAATCEVGFSDIALSDLRIDNNIITGKITNIGYKTAENISLTIKEDNQENSPIAILSYGGKNLAVGESWEFSQAVDVVTFRNVGDVKYYLLSAETDSIENNYINNSDIVYSVPIAPTKLSLEHSTLSLTEKTTAVISAEVLPENTTFKDVVYTSSDNAVVIVDNKGTIYAVGKGSAIVTAYTLDGSHSAKCEITVEGLTEEQYTLSDRELELEIEDEASLCIKDKNGDNVEGVLWTSTDEDIAIINQNGTVTAKGEGIVYLVAKIDTFTDVCIVRVSDHSIVDLACDESYLSLTIGETAQLNITIIPENTTMDKTLAYVSGDESIATVSASGVITAVTAGSTVITVSSVNGIQKNIEVVVDEPITYTVAFDSRGGTRVDSLKIKADKKVTEDGDEYIGYLASIPKTYKEGYSFAGWYTDKNGTGKALSTNTPITEDVIYYAKWQLGDIDDDSDTVLPDDIPADGIPDTFWIAGIDSTGYQYTGKPIKPTVRVYDGNKRLKAGQDYTLSYKNNTKANDASNTAKAPTITVKGKGNYGGKETATFKILPIDLNDTSVITEDIVVANTSKLQKKVPTLTYNGKKLTNKKDFTVSYPDLDKGIEDAYIAAGTYDVLLTAKDGGNFTGTRTVKFTITDSILISKAKVSKIPAQYYLGTAMEPYFTVTYNDATLVENEDYTFTYENNIAPGKAAIILTGIGDYAGTKKAYFTIKGPSFKNVTVDGIENKVYNGSKQEQQISVRLDNICLTEGVDYEVEYSNNQNAGKATITIKGINAYSGTAKKTFKITAYDIKANELSELSGFENEITAKYTKGGAKPKPTLTFAGKQLVEGKDYTITYKNNKAVTTEETQKLPAITIKGKGNFKGTLSKNFTITSKALNDENAPVTLTVADKGFVNKAGKYISKPTLTDSDGKKLIAGKDYEKEIIYSLEDGTPLTNESIVEAGTNIKVNVIGKGAYYGELETTYQITEYDFSKAKVKITPKVYTGNPITLDKDDITVRIGKDTLIYGIDYEVIEDSYINNKNKGTASVTIIGKGSYGGMKISKFKITSKGFVWFWRML